MRKSKAIETLPLNIDRVKATYQSLHQKFGSTPSALGWPKGRQNVRFKNLLEPIIKANYQYDLCDFGCGLAHMSEYLDKLNVNKLQYHGYEILEEFVNEAQKLNRNVKLIGPHETEFPDFNAIVASGVFNLRFSDNDKINQEYIFERLDLMLRHSQNYTAVDFMRSDVDYKQENAWHQSIDVLTSFVSKYSRNIEIIMTPLPYEFTIRVYHET